MTWPRFHEPPLNTLRRNIAIALTVGAALAILRHNLRLLLPFSVLALWFSLGGHYVEVAFLNQIRPRVGADRMIQIGTRIIVWFIGGGALWVLMVATARALALRGPRLEWWWFGGLMFIGIELLAHAALAVRRLPNFYNGQG